MYDAMVATQASVKTVVAMKSQYPVKETGYAAQTRFRGKVENAIHLQNQYQQDYNHGRDALIALDFIRADDPNTLFPRMDAAAMKLAPLNKKRQPGASRTTDGTIWGSRGRRSKRSMAAGSSNLAPEMEMQPEDISDGDTSEFRIPTPSREMILMWKMLKLPLMELSWGKVARVCWFSFYILVTVDRYFERSVQA
jgi:hypothetical protein